MRPSERLTDEVKNGGHVVMAFKSFADQYPTVRHVMAPGGRSQSRTLPGMDSIF
jgi:hypothetical protein